MACPVALPVHQLTLVSMGMWLFDNLDLERVAEVAAEQGRWEFMLVAGSPQGSDHLTGPRW
jgi:hypothetical protein